MLMLPTKALRKIQLIIQLSDWTIFVVTLLGYVALIEFKIVGL
ncbi:hypothetical protein [Bacillus sp. AFS041924]|nr:hypothetical protein [Bacillus sp. AFS041924]